MNLNALYLGLSSLIQLLKSAIIFPFLQTQGQTCLLTKVLQVFAFSVWSVISSSFIKRLSSRIKNYFPFFELPLIYSLYYTD